MVNSSNISDVLSVNTSSLSEYYSPELPILESQYNIYDNNLSMFDADIWMSTPTKLNDGDKLNNKMDKIIDNLNDIIN
jgi:hypothetical protein